MDPVSTDTWFRDWLEMLDRRQPGWRSGYDREGFQLAVEDLFGGNAPQVGPEGLDVLADFALNHDRETAELAAKELEESPAFRRAMIEFEYIFRAAHGSSRESSELRELRRRTMKRVVESVLDPMLARLVRIARAKEMRERRRARRHPRLPETALVRDPKGIAPDVEVLGREAADRVLRRARRELSPAGLRALGRFFADRDARPACEAAKRAGTSPATLTRAIQKLQEIAREELQGSPDAALRPFTLALVESLGAA